MTIRIGMVQINVTDLRRAWTFYVETLGFEARQSLGAGKPFELILGSPPRVLVYSVQRVVRSDYPNQTGITIVFHTNDIERTVKNWSDKGVEFIPISWSRSPNGIADSPFGRFIAFVDPFGNVHELLQPTGQE